MDMNKDTVWYRVRRAVTLGYLVNREDRKGQPAKLEIGDPLPVASPALPTVEEVQVLYLPESHSTIQPPAASASGNVESPLKEADQPPFNQHSTNGSIAERLNGDESGGFNRAGRSSTYEIGPEEARVERLNARLGGREGLWREAS